MNAMLLVGNPTAQSGKNAARIERAQALFAKHGRKVTLFSTLPDGATIPALTAYLQAHPHDTVVAMGGDGTFREVGAALMALPQSARPTMGMLPTGTANDQGKSFGLSASESALERNVQVVAMGKRTALDAGVVTAYPAEGAQKDYFFDSLSFGLAARVLHVRNQDRETVAKLGPLKELYRDHAVYAGAFAKTFLASYIEEDQFEATVDIDGAQKHWPHLTDLVLKATRVFAGSWVLDRSASHNDGIFELVPFVDKNDWTSKAIVNLEGSILTEDVLSEIGVEHSKTCSGKAFRFTLRALGSVPVYAQMDGEEYVQADRFDVHVEPQALQLLVP